MDKQTNDRRSLMMMLASMVIFGTVGIFRRNIPLDSAALACARGVIGSVFLLGYCRVRKHPLRHGLPARQIAWLAVTGAVIAFNWMFLFEAYNYTTVATATLCYYMQPTIVLLLSPLIFGERLSGRKLICAAAAIAGMVLVSGILNGSGGSLRGVLFGLIAASLYAAVVILNKKIGGVDAYEKTVIQLAAAAAVMIPYLAVTGTRLIPSGTFTGRDLVMLLIVGVVHTGVAYILYFGSMDGLRAQSIAILSYLDPVTALILSALLLREPMGLGGLIGAALILGATAVSELGKD